MQDKIQSIVDAINLCSRKKLNLLNRWRVRAISKRVLPAEIYRHYTRNNQYLSELTWIYQLKQAFKTSQPLPSSATMWHYVKQILSETMQLHALMFLIQLTIENEGVKEAMPYVEKSSSYRAYRLLLDYYAGEADLEHFLHFYKKAEPKKKQNRIGLIKCKFVSHYSDKFGVDLGLKLCQKAPFSQTQLYSALAPHFSKITYKEAKKLLKSILQKYPLVQEIDHCEACFLTMAFSSDKNAAHAKDFAELFQIVTAIPKTAKAGDFRLRDCLLLDIARKCAGNVEQSILCKKAIINPKLKN
ncbi:hypothetical protein IPG41_01360 [Candidatus Peregrinibacteria bacterium]|nr:MAG: hypothetical protein IPG41_01360 [Candidatus Peregrinibacteria bacterium]